MGGCGGQRLVEYGMSFCAFGSGIAGELLPGSMTHHVFEQHGQHAGQRRAQHILVHFRLAKSGPELACLNSNAFVFILQAGHGKQ